jgi:IS5 family transposase
MRQRLHDQLHLVPVAIVHVHAQELKEISQLLDSMPKVMTWVRDDLIGRGKKRVSAKLGRRGLTGEQVLRAMIVKQMNEFSYEELAFHLADSMTYRAFCRIGIDQNPPTKSRLQKNIKRVRAETWEKVLRVVVRCAAKLGVETGQKVRTDCTVVESNIHHPTDSSLLWDCVRVLVRLQTEAKEEFGLNFRDHSLRARRRAMGILNAKTEQQRQPLYRDLLDVTHKTINQAERISSELDHVEVSGMKEILRSYVLKHQLLHYAELTKRVIDQTQRRVLQGEQVPASDKIVSIFETHTDIIVKDRRETLYGHKICLTSGASGIVTDVVVEEGNPADSTLAVKMIERQVGLYGKAPRQASFDGGFTSKANLADIKALGVQDVAFSKRAGLSITEMAKSTWVYRRLRNFRAGIEGGISFLKRAFGLDRCTWSGFASFKAYVLGSVLACNLLMIARHLLGPPRS